MLAQISPRTLQPRSTRAISYLRGSISLRSHFMRSRVMLCSLAAFALLTVVAHAQDAKATKKTIKAADGVNIVCEVQGKGDTVLIFLHGWCGDREYWKNQV